MKPSYVLISLVSLSLLGCLFSQSLPVSVLSRPSPTFSPVPNTATPKPTTTPLPGYVPHRIGVRVIDGTGEFYDRQSGEKFIPRGYNYVRLAPINGASGVPWEATLSPGYYDPDLAEDTLQQMRVDGYNVVRVYVDCCRTYNNVGSSRGGLSSTYLDNVIDFLEKAKANEVFVLLVLHLTPADGGYNLYWEPYRPTFDGLNLLYLTKGGFQSKQRYDRDFIRTLISRQAPLDTIFAYDLTDDVVYEASQPPLTLKSGVISTANGKSYDMALVDDKIRMMKENLVYWINEQRAAILETDPTALVTVSFPAFVVNSRPTYPAAAIWESTADFIDLHVYLGAGMTLDDYVYQFGVNGMAEKPIIMGQFAATRQGFSSVAEAAQAMLDWQIASCQYGFDGWLLWLRGSESQTVLYNGMTDGGLINDTLAPVKRPDPCR